MTQPPPMAFATLNRLQPKQADQGSPGQGQIERGLTQRLQARADLHGLAEPQQARTERGLAERYNDPILDLLSRDAGFAGRVVGAVSRVDDSNRGKQKRPPWLPPIEAESPMKMLSRLHLKRSPKESSKSESARMTKEDLPDVTASSNFIAAAQNVALSRSSSSTKDPAAASSARWFEDMPPPVLFAGNKPSSKADAAMLNRYITNVLDNYAAKLAAGEEPDTELSKRVDELVPLLSIGLHELVRQISQHCSERGVVLEKMWRTYVELFDRALAETRAMLRFHKMRTERVHEELQRTRNELEGVSQKHPEQISKLSKTLTAKFIQRQEELETSLKKIRHENGIMQQLKKSHKDSTRSWFPLFDAYKDCKFRAALEASPAGLPATTTPESRLAADFKRILMAMPLEARRRVGFFVSSLLGLRGTELLDSPETLESLQERKEHNNWRIGTLEDQIAELKSRRRG